MIKTIEVEHNGRKRIIIIPLSGDKSYDDYLIESYTEQTLNELKKMPPKKVIDIPTQKDAIAAIRDFNTWVKRRRAGSKQFKGI